MVERQGAQTAQRQHRGHLRGGDEAAERLRRIGDGDAAATVDHRLLRARDQGQRLHQPHRHGVHHRRADERCGRRQVVGLRQLHVLRQVDQHRAGAAAARQVEGLVQHRRQLIDRARQVAVLDDRQGHAEHVQFLERVGAHQVRGHLPGDADHRHRIQQRVGDAGDEVRRAGARGRDANADATAVARVAVRGQRGRLLMPHQHVLHRAAEQGVVEGHDAAARIAEEGIDPFGLERLHQPLGSVHAPASAGVACGVVAVDGLAGASPRGFSHGMPARSLRPTASIGCSRSACFSAR